MVWHRARSGEQKEQRRQALLEAAARLHASQPIEEVSLNAIAREANISKANVYRYFESREELFLQLTLEAGRLWGETLMRRLRNLPTPASAEIVAATFAASIMEHPRFARLASVLSTVLERNVSTEVVVRFKTQYLGTLPPLLQTLTETLELCPKAAFQLLETAFFLMVGMWPAAHPPPEVRAALERPELQAACVDFEPRYADVLTTTIRGLRAVQD